jgi:hypothetical protein
VPDDLGRSGPGSNADSLGGLSGNEAARLLGVSPLRFSRLAEDEGLDSGGRSWNVAQLKRLALRLLIVGSSDEQEAARRALDRLRGKAATKIETPVAPI